MVSHENINTSRTLQTKQAIFIYTYMHETIIIEKKEAMNLKDTKMGLWEHLERERGREK